MQQGGDLSRGRQVAVIDGGNRHLRARRHGHDRYMGLVQAHEVGATAEWKRAVQIGVAQAAAIPRSIDLEDPRRVGRLRRGLWFGYGRIGGYDS